MLGLTSPQGKSDTAFLRASHHLILDAVKDEDELVAYQGTVRTMSFRQRKQTQKSPLYAGCGERPARRQGFLHKLTKCFIQACWFSPGEPGTTVWAAR